MRPAKNPETNRRLGQYEYPEATFLASEWLKNKKGYPMQALPVLENVPGVSGPINQTRAIQQYCAKLANLHGKDIQSGLIIFVSSYPNQLMYSIDHNES